MKQINAIIHNTTIRKGSLFTIYAFLNRGISFVLLIIIAQYLAPQGYGYVSMFSTIVTFLGYFICLGSTSYVAVSFFRNSYEDYRDTIRVVSDITIVCSFLLVVLSYFLRFQIEQLTGLQFKYLLFAIFISFSTVYTQTNLEIWRIEEKIGKYGIYSVSNAVLNFLFTIIFVVVLNQDWNGRVNAFFYLSILFFCISIVFFFKRKMIFFCKAPKRLYIECLKFSVPLIPHSITSWLRQGVDRITINNYHSIDQVGLFSLSFNFSSIILMIGNAFNATISVYIYKNLAKDADNVRGKLRKQTIIIICGYILLTAVINIGAYSFVPFLFPKYTECLPFVFFQTLCALFQCLYYQFVNFLFYYKKTKVLMQITLSVSLMHAILSFLLTRYSIFYTLGLEVLSSFVIMMVVFLYSRKIYKVI